MKWLHALLTRVRLVVFGGEAESRMEEEFRFHVDMETEANMRAGLSRSEARRRALVSFGGVDRHSEMMRDDRGARWLEELVADLRYALRALRRTPAFAVASVITLGIGLGVTTAATSVMYTVVLAPAPYTEPDRIVQIARERDGRYAQMLPPADVARLRESTADMLTLGVAGFRDVSLGAPGSPVRVRGAIVTGPTLGMLGVEPLRGRLPVESDDVPGGECVAVLSYPVWRDHFGNASDVPGGTVRLDGAPCVVMAVMPEGFAYPAPYFAGVDLWLLSGPAGIDWSAEQGPGFLVFGRLAPGWRPAAVHAALDVLSARDTTTGRLAVMRWAAPSRARSSGRLLILLAAAALVLVIAYINFVTLWLARTVDRRQELATRQALGASRGRLIRLMAAETTVLVVAGAAAGLLIARWSTGVMVALRSYSIPRMEEVTIGAPAVLLCTTLAIVAGLLAGTFSFSGLGERGTRGLATSSGRRTTRGRSGRRFGGALVMAQTTLALILLAGAALLTRSYRALGAIDPGFTTDGVLHARVTPVDGRYPDAPSHAAFYAAIETRIAAVPGVLGVALTSVPPGVGAGPEQLFAIAGRAPAPGAWPTTIWRPVSDGYFRVLDIPLLRGQSLDGGSGMPRGAVVNEAFVRRYFPDGDAIGQQLQPVPPGTDEPDRDAWTIVGVVADANEEYIFRTAPPAVYVDWRDRTPATMAILIRTAGSPLALAPSLRTAVAGVDPDQPIYGIRDLDFMLASEYDLNRLGMALLAIFAAAGIYGIVAHSVGQRLREMGIRIALGARATDVLRHVVGEAAGFAALGVAAGLIVVAAVGHILEALTPVWTGVAPREVAAAAMVVATIGLLAAYIPARRAASADPLDALRHP
jgi:predicted permease